MSREEETDELVKLDEEIAQLEEKIRTGLADAAGDYSEEQLDAGGWIEVVLAVVSMSDASVEARREALRRHGLAETRQAMKILGD